MAADAWLDELLLAYHALDLDGQGSGVAGHLSARLPGASTFWSHRFGTMFGEMRRAELLEADFDLNVLRGRPPINPTMHIHTRIYLARPDVNAIVHTHAANLTALSAIGARIEMFMQPVALFREDIAWLDEYEGIVLGKGEGEVLRDALGARNVLVLAGHGLLTVGATVGEAAYRAIRLEAAAGVQLAAMAAGKLRRLPEESLRQAQAFSLKVLPMQWAAICRDTLRRRPGILGRGGAGARG
ncbi:MAG: class II aldolase/adducin family protein [Betaproteobacteria bacterium]|nr:class II aldolase/adducin family protein [Betaproteobacteria bacterium]